MEPIVVHFMPTPSDYARASYAQLWKRQWWLLILVLLPICFYGGIYGISTLVLLLNNEETAFTSSGMACALLPILIPLAIPAVILLIPLILAWRVSRQPMLQTQTTYEFGEDAIVVKDAHSELKQKWGNYHKALATRDYYLLVFTVNKGAVRFIPRRAFESQEQENAFRELLARKLNFKG